MALLSLIILIAIVSLILFIHKVKTKNKLSKGLGREVEDHELSSITSWIEATPEKQPKYKKYIPAKKSVDPEDN
jgi:hypothetical protein